MGQSLRSTVGADVRELVGATMALDCAAKDFARETGYRAGLERALELAEDRPELADQLRAELRRVAWLSRDTGARSAAGPPRDRREAYVLAAERMVRAFDAAGVGDEYDTYAPPDDWGPPDIPVGFRSFGASIAALDEPV